jgi:hypothetical protein
MSYQPKTGPSKPWTWRDWLSTAAAFIAFCAVGLFLTFGFVIFTNEIALLFR